MTALPQGVGQFAIALLVEGSVCSRLLAIWTQRPNYLEQVHRILDSQADLLARSEPLVVAGDFNSNKVLDRCGAGHTHSAIVSRLLIGDSRLGLVAVNGPPATKHLSLDLGSHDRTT